MSMGSFTKGVALGIAAGAAVSMLISPGQSRKIRHMRKNAGKTIKSFGCAANSLAHFFR